MLDAKLTISTYDKVDKPPEIFEMLFAKFKKFASLTLSKFLKGRFSSSLIIFPCLTSAASSLPKLQSSILFLSFKVLKIVKQSLPAVIPTVTFLNLLDSFAKALIALFKLGLLSKKVNLSSTISLPFIVYLIAAFTFFNSLYNSGKGFTL